MSEEKVEKKDFIIKDRRFSAQESQDADTDGQEDVQKEASTAQEPISQAPDTSQAAESELPEINFMTFIMSLNASAMAHLGIIEDPATGQKIKNLALGKQAIDILGMLKEKTKGNLAEDEENMLKNILYDLRIIYVKEKT